MIVSPACSSLRAVEKEGRLGLIMGMKPIWLNGATRTNVLISRLKGNFSLNADFLDNIKG